MGQKVNPKIFRIGVLNQWSSKWFARREYIEFLKQDHAIKTYLAKKLRDAAVAGVDIERSAGNVTVIIHSAKPGIIIGRGGQGIEDMKKEMKRKFLKPKQNLQINIQEVTNPNMSAELVAQSMVFDLEKRIPYRRVLKQALGRIERTEAQGARVEVAGRLNGAEIARTEKLNYGRLPLHTLRSDINYAHTTAHTTYGVIGVKVWINRGEKFSDEVTETATKKSSRRGASKRKK